MIKMMRSQFVFFLLLLIQSFSAHAEKLTAMIASIQGTAQILDEKNTLGEEQKSLTYEGRRYYFSKARIGAKVNSGQGVMTSSDGKVKIIYQHGDVVIVGPSTSLFIPIDGGKVATKSEINLLYGKVRAVIDHDGPLSGVKIKTPSAVAGVRGTDLYVSYDQSAQSTEVQVLRGEVEVKTEAPHVAEDVSKKHGIPTSLPEKISTPAAAPATLIVKSGEKADIEMKSVTSSTTAPPVVEKSSKQDIARMQENTVLKVKPEDNLKNVKPEVAKQISVAEEHAVQNILKDIKKYDPEASANIEKKKLASVDLINVAAAEKTQAAAIDTKAAAVTASAPEEPPYIFPGKRWGVALADIVTAIDCSASGTCSNGTGNITAGAEIGIVRRSVYSDRWSFQTGALLDIRNVSFSQTNYNPMPTPSTTNAQQLFLTVPFLWSRSINSQFAAAFGFNAMMSSNSLT